MLNLLIVGLGGFLGSVLRFLVSGSVQQLFASSLFPVGTLAVNALGSFFLGGLESLTQHFGFFSPETRGFLFVGLLGAFTTFSTFSFETYNLFQDGQYLPAAVNVLLNLSICLLAVWLGRTFFLAIWR